MKKEGFTLFSLILVFSCIVVAATGQMILKTGMNEVGKITDLRGLLSMENFGRMATNKFVVFGVMLYAFSAVLWLGALSSLDVSYAYPFISLSYVLVAILAFIFLKENISMVRWMGIIVIIIGVFLISRT
ncbi:MAG: EamA family transporter [archaeon]